MKKQIIFLVLSLLFLISLSFISTLEVSMDEQFKSGETIQLKISGNFLEPILKEDVSFYRGNVKVPFDFNLAQIEEEYYIYSKQEKRQGYYSLEIKGARFWKGSELVEEDIKIPFQIANETADFSIDKGYVVTDQNFFIEVQNLADEKITITSNKEQTISLKSGDMGKINFYTSDFEKNKIEILELSTPNLKYQIPVYIFGEELEKTKTNIKLVIDSYGADYLNISMPTNSTINRVIYLYNPSEETIKNITLSISNSLKEFVELSAYNIDELEANSSVKLEIQIKSLDENLSIQGQLKTKISSEYYKYTPISIKFIKGYEPKSGEYGENTTAPGNLIEQDDLIDETEAEKSNTGRIIGWTILILILVFLAWFFMRKYRGAKGHSTSFDRAIGR